ncbi:1-(5-phosphoribosyl)-5-[(5-phosphoribosylamino)methylideneamino]imidazole-4-carboxamide isomerase [candidate division KSB1 bacterium]|nr:1-(5-phosphoribosyl)-5-[(5-phosphoribosylamino)methylideneamino]imidazole-4-carboxamide isomerase [candidate division KSB1 bacterium]
MLIIPAIDLLDGCCVRLKQGDPGRKKIYSADPVAMAQHWQEQGAAMLHLIDLDGAFGIAGKNNQVIEDVCRSVTIPVELGGGIRHFADAETWLNLGIHRIVVGTLIVEQPQTIQQMIEQFGSDRIVAGLDARKGNIAIKGWKEFSSQSLITAAQQMQQMGVQRIIYTDIQTDGLLQGPNYEAVRALAAQTDMKIIVSGGLAEKEHFQKLRDLNLASIEGVIVGTALYENRLNLSELISLYQ